MGKICPGHILKENPAMQNPDNTRAMRPEDLPQRPSTPAPNTLEPTQAMNPPVSANPSDDVLLQDEAKRRQLEAELSRMGLSPAEVRRLLFARSDTFEPTAEPSAPPTPARTSPSQLGSLPATPMLPTTPAKSTRVTASSLQQFAAQLTSNAAAAQVQAIQEVVLDLPEFRESSVAELRQAETLLREASMLRRREKYAEAMTKCREALTLVPKDAAALELYGDLLQGVAHINEALAVYKRATEADPKRYSAERKYGDLLMRQQNWNNGDPEAVPKNGLVASMLSLVVPGAGQIYNGDLVKGLFFLISTAISLFIIFWSPWGLNGRQQGVSIILTVTLVFVCVLYLIAVADANMTARGVKSVKRSRPGSGWEV
jgi:tetratricopeptide (TPR) repeat protein